MNKSFVTFYKIHHGWRTNSPVSMDSPIISCLCGMNISCWSHMSDWHQKPIFGLPKYNIMSPWWPTCQLSLDWIFLMKLQMLVHMSDWHRKELFFGLAKYNIMSPWWPTCQLSLDWIFLKMKLKMLKTGIEPVTPWSFNTYTTRLLLQFYCCASYYFFVLCSMYWFCPVSNVLGPTY
jgi:hypothetical protein